VHGARQLTSLLSKVVVQRGRRTSNRNTGEVWAWTAKIAAAFRRKIKSTPFPDKNNGIRFNASGVALVGRRRFVFVDNHDSTALFEFALDADRTVERILRRSLVGVAEGELGDPEGLTRVDMDGETYLIAASSLCVERPSGSRRHVNDGLVRVRYTPDGDLDAEAMDGFREWLLSNVPSLAEAGQREPDAGGLNIEGLTWDPRGHAMLFGLRGPATPGRITVIKVPVDPGGAWTTEALDAPSVLLARIPQSTATQGIRDICYDEQTGGFVILLGRSLSQGDEPFQLCTWDGNSDEVRRVDVKFHRTMKPEGVTTFSSGDEKKILIVDDGGGYAVLDYGRMGFVDQ
jgi:hypothetical protein